MLKKLIFTTGCLFILTMSFAQSRVDSINIIQPDSMQTGPVSAAANDSISPSQSDSIATIKKYFDAFEYGEVIKFANRILQSGVELSNDNLIQIYRMKGISHYSLTEDQAAKESFIQILMIDSSFTLDSAKTSPKIISYFKDIKNSYLQQIQAPPVETIVRVDTVLVPIKQSALLLENHIRQTLFLSLIFPGLGHLYDGRKTTGWILTSLTAISLASTIYFTIGSNKKEDRYLNENNPLFLESKYKIFSDSYNYRNISIAALAAIWLYSQLDLFLFTDRIGEKEFFEINPTLLGINLRVNF